MLVETDGVEGDDVVDLWGEVEFGFGATSYYG